MDSKKRLLASIFCDGAVLQQKQEIRVWGVATEKADVDVRFFESGRSIGESYTAMSDEKGNWELALPALSAGGPYELHVQCGAERVAVKDILIGEVWLCSGQSNMQLPMERVKNVVPAGTFEIENPKIRQFLVPIEMNFHGEQDDFAESRWISVCPKHTADFSAAGFFFAQKLYEELNVPIGLVLTAVGGTPIQTWMSREALQAFPEELTWANQCQDDEYVAKIEKENQTTSDAWYKALVEADIGLKDEWFQTDFDDNQWGTLKLSDSWAEHSDLKECGSVWLRFTLDIPKELACMPAKLFLGCIVDADHVYVNGKLVGNITYRYPPREYDIKEWHVGRNVIAVRVTACNGTGGFVQGKEHKLVWKDHEIHLNGEWKYKRAVTCEAITPTIWLNHAATGLYNQMIAPLHRYAVKGVTWYQGESNTGGNPNHYDEPNTGKPNHYADFFRAMVLDWRKRWAQERLPFIFVQLANYIPPEPSQYSWAVLREQQRLSLQLPDTAMVVAIDVGEYNDLHPVNKQAIGERLALASLKMAYDFDVVHSGPLFRSAEVVGDELILHFDTFGSELAVRNGEVLGGFTILSEDGYQSVSARMKDNRIVIALPNGNLDGDLTYGWADDPYEANLINTEGLPASPFRYAVL